MIAKEQVAPSRARGLKRLDQMADELEEIVAPSRARGLKPPGEERQQAALLSRLHGRVD